MQALRMEDQRGTNLSELLTQLPESLKSTLLGQPAGQTRDCGLAVSRSKSAVADFERIRQGTLSKDVLPSFAHQQQDDRT
ncbi:unnamed protein product [Protopolystoma xenopodis]|uniref:Uncharacterized protein n=1 Tax=Protopolystoma xenopodis TaxID=117903 RepID=A0A448WA70_9PLAT|nr:unnamed protein product [Protopolystoma xenopodis]